MCNLSIYMDLIEKINSLCMGEKKAPVPKDGALNPDEAGVYTRVRVTSMLPRVAFE